MNKKYQNLLKELQNTLDEEYRLVCTKLTHIIASYVREHNFKAPESVLKLYNYLANGDAQYRGLASFITWF